MSTSVEIFKGIRLQEIEGEILVNLEDVSKGLGFIQTKNDVLYIRKNIISKHLKSFGFPISWEDNLMIPESAFYLLAMIAVVNVA